MQMDADGSANSVDPDQTSLGPVCPNPRNPTPENFYVKFEQRGLHPNDKLCRP